MAERFSNRTMNRNNVAAPSPRAEGSGNGGCAGGCSENGACKALMRRLQTLDFSIVDTVLYLDAYPNSAEALAYYNKLIAERGELVSELARSCHQPITHMDNASPDAWHWVNAPWPWELEAN